MNSLNFYFVNVLYFAKNVRNANISKKTLKQGKTDLVPDIFLYVGHIHQTDRCSCTAHTVLYALLSIPYTDHDHNPKKI